MRFPSLRRLFHPPFALAPLAAAAALCAFAADSGAQALPRVRPTPLPALRTTTDIAPPPVTLTADDVVSHIGGLAQASGNVELKRDDLDLRADLLSYDQLSDTAHAQGHVRIDRGLDWFSADRLDLELTRSAGTLLGTEFEIGARKAGGHAQRVELVDRDHTTAYAADYSSCPRDTPRPPDWIITGDRIDIDTSTNEGKATHAVLRFLGVPILAAPSLTFPVTADRKSGWLPPTLDFSLNSGLALGVPYYWNIEPNLDATLTPAIITKRGAQLTTELRYLRPSDLGQVTATALPDDRVAGFSRGSVQWAHEGARSDWLTYSARVQRVSDDLYWKDFPNQMPALTQRLLPADLSGTRRFLPFGEAGEIDAYARVQRFQTLQDPQENDAAADIQSPYQRSPQIGLRGNVTLGHRLRFDFETEADRFDLSQKAPGDTRVGGTRADAIGAVSREFDFDWGRIVPRIALNGATYHTDADAAGGRVDATRWIPTFSTDSTFGFERRATLFGRDLVQTLEPHLLYVLTPYHDQSKLPIYDTAAKDFNEVSIYSDNPFTGIDRIADENQLTAGATTRYNDASNGRELLKLGVAQRFLFKNQALTPDGSPDHRKISDLLLYGSSSAMEHWSFDGTVDLNLSSGGTQNAVVSTRYHPGPFKSMSLTYRYARGSSEAYEVAGQWPVYHREPGSDRDHGCGGTLYAVGRVDYSVTDSRATYAIGGFEYDAGCWIGRVMVERTSTGRNESTTHLVLQLELNGLSTLGTGSLRVLKDNVPGYQPLRNDPGAPADPLNSQ
ncbi:MAG: LPS assembly protein LptD [Burkholderiaceae bacterium]